MKGSSIAGAGAKQGNELALGNAMAGYLGRCAVLLSDKIRLVDEKRRKKDAV